jgi:hypothetical protein
VLLYVIGAYVVGIAKRVALHMMLRVYAEYKRKEANTQSA